MKLTWHQRHNVSQEPESDVPSDLDPADETAEVGMKRKRQSSQAVVAASSRKRRKNNIKIKEEGLDEVERVQTRTTVKSEKHDPEIVPGPLFQIRHDSLSA